MMAPPIPQASPMGPCNGVTVAAAAKVPAEYTTDTVTGSAPALPVVCRNLPPVGVGVVRVHGLALPNGPDTQLTLMARLGPTTS